MCSCVAVVAVDEHAAGSALRMPDDQAGSDVIDESRRSMGLLRLGRSRWGGGESAAESAAASRRSMGLLRLGRSDADTQDAEEDEKRSMQLLRLGRKRNSDEDEAPRDQMRRRYAVSIN